MDHVERRFDLLPSEEVLWQGRPAADAGPDWAYRVVPLLLALLGSVAALFSAALAIEGLPGSPATLAFSIPFFAAAVAVYAAHSHLILPSQYLVTDRRVYWRRGRLLRSIDRRGITYARVRWHGRLPTVGHLELVRAVPFGPLARCQRLTLHHLEAPDEVLSIIRGEPVGPYHGDGSVSLALRLDPDERLEWGGGPEGSLLDFRNLVTAALGAAVLVVGVRYLAQAAGFLMTLDEAGMAAGSASWSLLCVAMAISATMVVFVGLGLVWYGLIRARSMGLDTEYMLTDRRLLIRRGFTELSLDRRRIVDVAESPSGRGLVHLYLILDAPEARALADSGAMGVLTPAREPVPPVLYELRDAASVRDRLLAGVSSAGV